MDSHTLERAAPDVRTGVLALQGDFLEHEISLRRLGAEPIEVRLPRDLDGVDALIIPGGESTTMVHLLDLHGLREPVQRRAREGMPVWGTCAGMILLASALVEERPEPLGLMDITVQRNAYGRQLQSFETELAVTYLGEEPIPAVFIRAPAIVSMGEGVETLASLPDGMPVAVRQSNVLATSFHPELTTDTRFHRHFLDMAALALGSAGSR
ncbi:MAG: pyridoxal 5'-phosphate synthase glutaminase subunit PdxT [Chloroflexi bacterium]|nr:pyridoxal 5'-phosphate synthase glutaminase subunit PdxT [Chloroflexota bacterium]